jgi:pimeloyl-ACP methyl ester carboxylesterase
MRLFFRHFGTGEPVIILHGVFGMSDNWVSIGRRLASTFSVFIPDQRNHGHSPHSHTFNYSALTEDLMEFIEENSIEAPVLIGHSMGGKVAMNFVMDVSLPVRKLVVIDISPRSYPPRQEHIQILQAMRSVDFNRLKTRSAIESEIRIRIESERIQAFILKNLYRINEDRMGWRINLEALNENLEVISGAIPAKGIFRNPTLFLKGQRSDYITDTDELLIKESYPAAIIKSVPGASHWVHADEPDLLCSMLGQFLQKDCYSI